MSREINVYEKAAKWLFHKEYAAQAKGAITFYAELSQYNRNLCVEMVDEILSAAKQDGLIDICDKISA